MIGLKYFILDSMVPIPWCVRLFTVHVEAGQGRGPGSHEAPAPQDDRRPA